MIEILHKKTCKVSRQNNDINKKNSGIKTIKICIFVEFQNKKHIQNEYNNTRKNELSNTSRDVLF